VRIRWSLPKPAGCARVGLHSRGARPLMRLACSPEVRVTTGRASFGLRPSPFSLARLLGSFLPSAGSVPEGPSLASPELRPPLQSMTGGSCPLRKQRRRASLGFLPLQRSRNRRSTYPGFPAPGSFPSQRFSRSQGFAPSDTAAGLFHPAGTLGVPPPRLPSIRRSRPPKGPSSIAFARSRPFRPAQAPYFQVGGAYLDRPRRAPLCTRQAELQRTDLRPPSSLLRPEGLRSSVWPPGVPVSKPRPGHDWQSVPRSPPPDSDIRRPEGPLPPGPDSETPCPREAPEGASNGPEPDDLDPLSLPSRCQPATSRFPVSRSKLPLPE